MTARKTPAPAPAARFLQALRSIRNFFTGFAALIIGTGVFFGLLAVSSYYTLGYFIRGEEVVAPDVTGRSVTDALELLKARNLLIELDRSEPSEALESGIILRQRPKAGSRVKTHTPVRVVVSTGPSQLVLPYSLVGVSQAEAGIELRRLGVGVGNVSYLNLPGKDPDTVLALDPPAGTGLMPGSTVNLLVAAGAVAPALQMPDLHGLTEEKGRSMASQLGLAVTISRTGADPSARPGTIQEQSIPAGTPVTRGQSVSLVVRAGL